MKILCLLALFFFVSSIFGQGADLDKVKAQLTAANQKVEKLEAEVKSWQKKVKECEDSHPAQKAKEIAAHLQHYAAVAQTRISEFVAVALPKVKEYTVKLQELYEREGKPFVDQKVLPAFNQLLKLIQEKRVQAEEFVLAKAGTVPQLKAHAQNLSLAAGYAVAGALPFILFLVFYCCCCRSSKKVKPVVVKKTEVTQEKKRK
eukprot:TRINITY_DN769_c0_g1_i1.p1 TRINITY_DN769_c0_g1~~TRINITY_DN769_c0_g1_i1.p1  ORF type:complete len:217 (+),score=100.22 TRINITY_DN769_c0_g1_i1:45-653(+)